MPRQQSLPLAMIPIRSPRMSASSMLWVVSTMAHCFFTEAIRSHRCRREIGSMPVQSCTGCIEHVQGIYDVLHGDGALLPAGGSGY